MHARKAKRAPCNAWVAQSPCTDLSRAWAGHRELAFRSVAMTFAHPAHVQAARRPHDQGWAPPCPTRPSLRFIRTAQLGSLAAQSWRTAPALAWTHSSACAAWCLHTTEPHAQTRRAHDERLEPRHAPGKTPRRPPPPPRITTYLHVLGIVTWYAASKGDTLSMRPQGTPPDCMCTGGDNHRCLLHAFCIPLARRERVGRHETSTTGGDHRC